MIRYHISYDNPLTHFIKVRITFQSESTRTVLRLPSWRPGRYQIQNFAKNLKGFEAFQDEQPIGAKKKSKDSWELEHVPGSITVTYEYHAFKMDAGSSWLDDEQLYLNFINFAMYVEGGMEQVHEVKLSIPENYRVATGLRHVGEHIYDCNSYYELVDSPLMASDTIRQVTYSEGEHDFHIWIQGELPKSDKELIADFRPFTKIQMRVMGGFPCPDYHFLVQCLPYKHYHGVEHLNSTVITIGPGQDMKEGQVYRDFLGVSSHELFHSWNVIRIRPSEMSPYNFQRENYHETGFVTEGVTTYYGDLFLARSGVYPQEEYLQELNRLLKRHYDNEGRKHHSVADSSFDLWLDGYEKGIPGRKVSIYNEGALAALMLDLKIRLKTNHERSLDDVMRLMWQRHQWQAGGYTYDHYKKAAEEVFEGDLSDYFEHIISGTMPYEEDLRPLFETCGLQFEQVCPDTFQERKLGLKLLPNQSRHIIEDIAHGSPASQVLSRKDEILKVNGNDFEGNWPETQDGQYELQVNRFGRLIDVALNAGKNDYFPVYRVAVNESASEAQKENLRRWLHE